MTFGQAGGLVTVADTSIPAGVAPGERLRRALADLDHEQGEEANRRAAERQEIQDAIDRIAGAPPELRDYMRKILGEHRGGG